jgi:hypothetical protein
MSTSTTMQFAAVARLIAGETQRFGLLAPSFRSPPRVIGVNRTVRRREGGGVVAVALRDRPFVAILGDMIEGVVVVNQLNAPDSDHVRTALWSILSIHGYVATQEVDVHAPAVQPRVA